MLPQTSGYHYIVTMLRLHVSDLNFHRKVYFVLKNLRFKFLWDGCRKDTSKKRNENPSQ